MAKKKKARKKKATAVKSSPKSKSTTKKKSVKKKAIGRRTETIEIHVSDEMFERAKNLKASDAKALEALLQSILGHGSKIGVDKVVIKPTTPTPQSNWLTKPC